MDTVIFIIIAIIFYTAKRILEGGDSPPPPTKRPSTNEVKEYLEKMRGQKTEAKPAQEYRPQNQEYRKPQEYRAPSTKPSGEIRPKPYSKTKPKKHGGLLEPVIIEAPKTLLESLEPSKEDTFHDAFKETAKESSAKEYKSPVKTKKDIMAVLNKKVMQNTRFSDIQRAVILQEVFNKPKSMQSMQKNLL